MVRKLYRGISLWRKSIRPRSEVIMVGIRADYSCIWGGDNRVIAVDKISAVYSLWRKLEKCVRTDGGGRDRSTGCGPRRTGPIAFDLA